MHKPTAKGSLDCRGNWRAQRKGVYGKTKVIFTSDRNIHTRLKTAKLSLFYSEKCVIIFTRWPKYLYLFEEVKFVLFREVRMGGVFIALCSWPCADIIVCSYSCSNQNCICMCTAEICGFKCIDGPVPNWNQCGHVPAQHSLAQLVKPI